MSPSRVLRRTVLFVAAGGTLACSSASTTAAPPAGAAPSVDSGAFIIRLGNDTIAAERYTATASRLEGESLVRATQQTELRRYAIDYRGDTITGMTVERHRANAPAGAALQRITVAYAGDSARVTTAAGDSSRTRAVPASAVAIPLLSLTYAPFQLAIARAQRAGADSVAVPIYTLGSAGAVAHPIRRIAGDSVTILTPFALLRARTDASGRILGLHAPGSTFQVVVTRVPSLDWDALVQSAAERPVGMLSPRDTARGTIGQATVLIDYGRPMRRGRDIFGNVVAWNEVWRTGANTATHLTTDRDLMIGDTRVPAGTYTLWSIPSPSGWTLIVNKQTKQWGTNYDPAQDLARIPMQTRPLEQPVEQLTLAVVPQGSTGVLRLQWDRTEATVPVREP